MASDTITLDTLRDMIAEARRPRQSDVRDRRMGFVSRVQNGDAVLLVPSEQYVKGDHRGEDMPPAVLAARYSSLLRDEHVEGIRVIAGATAVALCTDAAYVEAISLL